MQRPAAACCAVQCRAVGCGDRPPGSARSGPPASSATQTVQAGTALLGLARGAHGGAALPALKVCGGFAKGFALHGATQGLCCRCE